MQYLISALLAVYFLFFLHRLGSESMMRALNALTLLDWLSFAFPLIAVSSGIYLFGRYKNSRLTNIELLICALSIFIITLFISFPLVLAYPAMGILVAAFLATIGWIFTNYTNNANHRKAHTMNVLLQMRNSSEFQKHRLNLISKQSIENKINKQLAAQMKKERNDSGQYKDGKVPTLDSIVYLANYYEFISLGVENGDLDEEMIRGGAKVHLYEISLSY